MFFLTKKSLIKKVFITASFNVSLSGAVKRRGEGPESDLFMTVITPAHDNVSIHQLSFLCLTSLNTFYYKHPPQHRARGGASILIGRLVKCS